MTQSNQVQSKLLQFLHIQQIALFLFRGGIEIYQMPLDNSNQEKLINLFLDNLWKDSQVDLWLPDLWYRGACTGQMLIYVRPTDRGYSISYYDKNQFEVYFDDFGEINKAIINSERKTEKGEIIRTKLEITATYVKQSNGVDPDVKVINVYGFVPVVFIPNRSTGKGKPGKTEFHELMTELETHGGLKKNIEDNTEFFGGPIFYSSRSKEEMIEIGLIGDDRNDGLNSSGWGRNFVKSLRVKARRIIDGLMPNEQIGFSTPDPISQQLLEYQKGYTKDIREGLGGIDEKGSNPQNTSTFYVVYAKPINTAKQRAKTYIDYGVIQAFKMALLMAIADKRLKADPLLINLKWRYLGQVCEESASEKLTRSIVARNLLRLGVNVKQNLKWLFSDLTDVEIDTLLDGGFPYELIKSVAEANQNLQTSYDKLDLRELINPQFLNEQVLDRLERVANESIPQSNAGNGSATVNGSAN
jgi:hypothetical protein